MSRTVLQRVRRVGFLPASGGSIATFGRRRIRSASTADLSRVSSDYDCDVDRRVHPSSGRFPLGRVFETRPQVTLERDRVVPSGDTVMPYFRVFDPDRDRNGVLPIFDGLPELRSAVLMEDLGESGLFRAEWEPDHLGIMNAIATTGVTVLSASGSRDGWTFELRSPTVSRFSAFQQYCAERDIDVTLVRLNQRPRRRPNHRRTAQRNGSRTNRVTTFELETREPAGRSAVRTGRVRRGRPAR